MRKRRLSRRNDGFSLIELLITLTLLSVIMGSLFGVIVRTQREYTRQQIALTGEEILRAVEQSLTVILRSGGADPRTSGLTGFDPDPMNHGRFDNIRVVSDFNPADGDVLDDFEDVTFQRRGDTVFVQWRQAGVMQPLAYPVADMVFEYYDADNTLLTTNVQAAAATKVRIALSARSPARPNTLERRHAWVYLRNRT